MKDRRTSWYIGILTLAAIFFLSLAPAPLWAAAPAGYSEYYIPGDEDSMMRIFELTGGNDQDQGGTNGVDFCAPGTMHSEITVTAWSGSTTIYYDHWEDGYDFDPDNPTTADETHLLANRGDSQTFTGTNIELPRVSVPGCPSLGNTFYDGRDRLYVAGGATTVSRVSWTDMAGTLLSVAWEVYPLEPQLTNYVFPFGEDLDGAPGLADFERVFGLLQAVEDGTSVTLDFDGDGTADAFDPDRDLDCSNSVTSITLNEGEVFLVEDDIICPTGGTVDTGIIVTATSTLQVQYVIGDEGSTYEIRGLSAFPRGFWDDEYYAPVDSADPARNDPTDLYLHNPHAAAITIDYSSTSLSGSFNIPANSTVSFQAATGSWVPTNTALYLKGSDVFWGVSTVDVEGSTHDWGYSLVPAFMLSDEHFMGWAPGSEPVGVGGSADNSGIFIATAQDNVRVFVDTDNDLTADQTFDLDRLQSQYVFDAADGDMSQANIWATGPYTVAYGQNPDTSPTAVPAIDVGYTTIPGSDFIDLVLDIQKTSNPVVVPTAAGSQATYTLDINTHEFEVDGISVVDTLPAGWQYVAGTTSITLADKTTRTDDPAVAGQNLTWSSAILGDMAPNQQILITFTARTTMVFAAGDITRNFVAAAGTRTIGSPSVTQTFITSDFAFNSFGDVQITKTSSGIDPLSPGDPVLYTVTVTNPGTSPVSLTGLAIYDEIPEGMTYVAASSQVTAPSSSVGDRFSTVAYNNNDGTAAWVNNWTEVGDDGNPAAGNLVIVNGELTMDDRPNSGGSPYVRRRVNLAGATTATMTFDWKTTSGVDNSDSIDVWVWNGGWTNIDIITNITGAQSGTNTYDLTPYISATTDVVLRVRANYGGTSEQFIVDNLFISYDAPSVSPGGDPPNFVTADENYQVAPGQSLTLTFNADINDPLGSGIESVTNSASFTSNEYPLPIYASVTNTVVNPGASSATVGDRIWFDVDGDGLQDVGEPGLANVEVTLMDQFGTPLVSTNTTDTTGTYLFTNIEPGTGYYIEVTDGIAAGLQQSAPAGHSDNRTDTFTLAAGDNYLIADVGYTTAPGSAAIGDLVWSDADGDGFRDAGEPGIAGVTVAVYLDDGDLVFEPLSDTLVTTTVSAADGTYLLGGLTAAGTEDYHVWVDDTQAVLTGYSATTPFTYLTEDVSGGDVLLNFDFGFRNAAGTFSLVDRVWYDVDEDGDDDDGIDDNGESGIAGVTVALLDASLVTIASTTTGADGYFSFNGLIGAGADYTVRVTDTGGILTDYFGTTPGATVGRVDVVNLSADFDPTVEPSEPTFGYGLRGSIGDRIYNDVDGSGTLDAGEMGISGVTVSLYSDDNGDTLLDGGDTLLFTVATNATGNYLFSTLANGDYIVSIPSTPAGHSYTSESPDNDGAAGEQQATSIAGGGSDLDLDFGYQAIVPRSLAGTFWDDDNADGVRDAAEMRIAGVSLAIYRDDGDASYEPGTDDPLVGTTSTDFNGDYAVFGLTPDDYWVIITDTLGILSGYDTTYELSEGALSPIYDDREWVDLNLADVSGIDFGYNKPVPTMITLASFTAFYREGQVVVRWETSAEYQTAGFSVERRDRSTGAWIRINDAILPALLNSPTGGVYSIVDSGAVPGGEYSYRLVEHDFHGETAYYGPFRIHAGPPARQFAGTSPADGGASFRSARRPVSQRTVAATLARVVRATPDGDVEPGNMANVTVDSDGMVFLSAWDGARHFGKPVEKIRDLIRSGSISLTLAGTPVPWLAVADGRGLIFYGEKSDSPYAAANVYRVGPGRGTAMKTIDPPLPSGPVDRAFTETIHVEEEQEIGMSFANDPDGDYWLWKPVYAGFAGLDTADFTFAAPGLSAAPGGASLRIGLLGITETVPGDDHRISIALNGQILGETSWDGQDRHEAVFDLDGSLLSESDNTLVVTALLNTGVPYGIVYVDDFDVSYSRRSAAVGDALVLQVDGQVAAGAGGFTDPRVSVFDVTDPASPRYIRAAVRNGVGGNYNVRFTAPRRSGRYLAVTPKGLVNGSLTPLRTDGRLRDRSTAADYVIITRQSFAEGAANLAAYREAQGLRTIIVTVPELVDEFNEGIYSPEAVRNFLRFTKENWRQAPGFVVLVGEGTYDYRNHQGLGDNLVPTMIINTPYGLAPSDVALGDTDGDGLPEFAIGRLPVLTPDELDAVRNKIESYESSLPAPWKTKVTLAADDPDLGGEFDTDSEVIADLIPGIYDVTKVYLSLLDISTARADLQNELASGTAFLNYVGHGGPDRLAQEGLLTTADISIIATAGHWPVVTSMTCSAGHYAVPGNDSLAETLLLDVNGAAAVWAPSWLSINAEAHKLDQAFFDAALVRGEPTLGTAILDAVTAYGANPENEPYIPLIYNLMGDPATLLP